MGASMVSAPSTHLVSLVLAQRCRCVLNPVVPLHACALLVACVKPRAGAGVERHGVAGKVVAREPRQKNARLVKEMKNVAHLSYPG